MTAVIASIAPVIADTTELPSAADLPSGPPSWRRPALHRVGSAGTTGRGVPSASPLLDALRHSIGFSLFDQARRVSVLAGNVLFRQGDPATDMYVVLAGALKITRSSHRSSRLTAVLGPGDQCGALAVVDGSTHLDTAEACTPTDLVQIDRESLRDWVTCDPAVRLQLLQTLLQNLRETQSEVADAIFSDVGARLAKLLLQLAHRVGTARLGHCYLDVPLSQSELAQLVGSSRETTNKVLSDFARNGWIRWTDSRQIVILDASSLTRRSTMTNGRGNHRCQPGEIADQLDGHAPYTASPRATRAV